MKNLTPTTLCKSSHRKGFTLAEILITLTVIGVVAALTIPTLLQNTNQAEFKTALKRTFADLSQATIMIRNEKGGSLKNAFGNSNLADSENLKNAYRDKLSYIKDCSGDADNGGTSTGVSDLGCWHKTNQWQYLNGGNPGIRKDAGLILSNGTLIYFDVNSSSCAGQTGDYYRCGFIIFDVNGFKKPNTIGKDIFAVNITDSELIPIGARGFYDSSTDCTSTGYGFGCTAKFLYE